MSFIKYSARMAVLVAALFSCKSPSSENKQAKLDKMDSGSSPLVNADSAYIKYLKPMGDSLLLPSFEIAVSLSPQAEAKLKKAHETVIVWASFTGTPIDTTSEAYQQSGEFYLAESRIELSDKRVAKFEGIKFPKALYDSLANKDLNVLINIYSGRRSFPDNLLDCEILEKPMSEVSGNRFLLKGKLIGE